MRIIYREDPPFEVVARKVRILPAAYRRRVWGLGMVAIGRHIAIKARRRAPKATKGKHRGALRKSIRAARVTRTWAGGVRPHKGSAIVFSLAKYARYVEGVVFEGETPPNAPPQPYLIPVIQKNKAAQLREFRRAVGSHLLETTRQIATGRLSAARARL